MPSDLLGSQFHRLATQYYVAARASVHAGLLPVPGNLFHHAIELFLKGHLSASLGQPELKKLGHHLVRLWQAFAATFPREDLSRHTPTIGALHAFETIRYPDEIVAHGMYSTISFAPFAPLIETAGSPSPPGYHIVVQDIDQLVQRIFGLASLNTRFYFGMLSKEAKAALLRDNTVFGPTDVYGPG